MEGGYHTLLWERVQGIRHDSGQAFVPLWGEHEKKECGPGSLIGMDIFWLLQKLIQILD